MAAQSCIVPKCDTPRVREKKLCPEHLSIFEECYIYGQSPAQLNERIDAWRIFIRDFHIIDE